jgi:hypothetical protein
MKLWLVLLFIPIHIGMINNVIHPVKQEIKPNVVTLTTYNASVSQCDSTPLVTASGFKIDASHPGKHRIIAISRDLKKLFKFGQKVKLSNAGRFNGVYYVHDVMNKRFKNKIDVLINNDVPIDKLNDVLIERI